jgi:hypothetical protein
VAARAVEFLYHQFVKSPVALSTSDTHAHDRALTPFAGSSSGSTVMP